MQFLPHDGQLYYEEGPVGCIYGISENEISIRMIKGEMKDGRYWVLVPPSEAAHKLGDGDLGSVYHWMTLLQGVEQARR